MRQLTIGIVGATGLVGQTFLKVLEKTNLSIKEVILYASQKSAGKVITFQNKQYKVLELKEENIIGQSMDYALFSAGGSISEQYAPIFANENITVIDNSSAWRMIDEVPLVVPEINLGDITNQKIIANPNCSTIQSVVPIKALMSSYNIKDIHYTTYQAVSGSGSKGLEDLKRTTKGETPTNYKYPIYNNVLPQIDVFYENGYTKEEIKMILETKKILKVDCPITATCVRVPVENSHSVSITLELDKEIDLNEVKTLIANYKGVKLIDNINEELYPIPTMATNQYDVLVGRVRVDYFNNKKLHLFCVADNILKGAALNAVQILEALEKRSENNG